VLGDGGLKCVVDLAQAVLEDLAEPDQDGRVDAAKDELIDQFFEIHSAARLFLRVNPKIAVLTDRKIALAPCRNIVQIVGVTDCPAFGHIQDLDGIDEFDCQFAVTSTDSE
jgi:hypothetical protein